MDPKFHYRLHKCPPPVPILSQLDPVHIPSSLFLKIHLIIFPSTPVSPKLSLSPRFTHQKSVYAPPPYAVHAPPISFFSILSPKQYLVSRHHKAPHYVVSTPPVSSSLLGPNSLFNTLFSNTVSLRSSLIVSDQVAHPYKEQSKLYFFISYS